LASKKVLVLGGGTGGYVASTYLKDAAREYGVDLDVTLVTNSEWFYMPPLWLDVAVEGLALDETRAPIRNLSKYGVDVVVDPVASIDPANRLVTTEGGRAFDYDYLVIAMGVTNAWSRYEGLSEAGLHNYDPESALRLHEALASFRGGRVVILAPEMPYRCGIYPLEMSTVLAAKFSKRGVRADITVVAPRMPNGATIAEALGPSISRLWRKYLDKYGVKLVAHDGLERVDPERRVVVTRNSEHEYDLLIKVPPPGLPGPLDTPEFRFEQDPRFAKARAPDFRHPTYDDVYLVGDHSMPPTGLTLAGVFIHTAAIVAAKSILGDIDGLAEPAYAAPVTCAAYVADSGWLGTCEVAYDTSTGMYTWNDKCYVTMESPLIRLVKKGFYAGWLSRLRFDGVA